jgi:hypothetical protein
VRTCRHGPHGGGAPAAARRAVRDAHREAVRADAAGRVGPLTERDLLLLGAAIYWCEGSKAKPWRPQDVGISFVNSDPGLIDLFLRFLAVLGVPRDALKYRVSIHESADAAAAERWWAERLDLPRERFQPTTLKRHSPATNRRNTGEAYHGCLVVKMPRGREVYWQIEGVMRAITEGVA